MTELLVTTAPVFRVEDEVHGELARDLLALEIAEDTSGLRTLVLRMVARGPVPGAREEGMLYLDGRFLDLGQRLSVALGGADEQRTVFTGWISCIEAVFHETREPMVVVMAEDELMTLRMTRRSRTYRDVTDADIAEQIASEHGLRADVDADGPTLDVVQQLNQSDLAFLRERARTLQADVWAHDGTLHFRARERRDGTEITLVQGNQLIETRLRADLAHQRTEVRVSGYDADARAVIDETGGPEVLQAEITGGRTGADVLRQAFGDRVSLRVRDVALTDGEASAWARAEMLRRGRAFVTVQGTTNGTADMVVGSRLTLERVGGPFTGADYYVTRVRHSYDLTEGFRTHFEAERPVINEAS